MRSINIGDYSKFASLIVCLFLQNYNPATTLLITPAQEHEETSVLRPKPLKYGHWIHDNADSNI